MSNITQRVAGIIFVAGDAGVSLKQIAEVLNETEIKIYQILLDLQLKLSHDKESPIELTHYNEEYRFVTKASLHKDVVRFAQMPYQQSLSRAAIETLAIIAYRQPITRVAVDEIRGVSSANMIQNLLKRNLIKEIGRIESPGRPYLYGVTDYFMDYFGLTTLEDLPEIEPLAINAKLTSEALFETKQWHIEMFNQVDTGDESKE